MVILPRDDTVAVGDRSCESRVGVGFAFSHAGRYEMTDSCPHPPGTSLPVVRSLGQGPGADAKPDATEIAAGERLEVRSLNAFQVY